MKKFLCLMSAMIMCLSIVGCGNVINEPVDGGETFEVIETLTMGQYTYKFDYSNSTNCVTVTIKEFPDISMLFYVNKDGAITTYCTIQSGVQYTNFEETNENFPETTYNDAGYPRSVEYDKLMVTYEYNNYIDNILTTILYSSEDEDWTGKLIKDEQRIYLGDYDDEYSEIEYTRTENSRYKMFSSVEWFLSMVDNLDGM